MDVVYPLKRGGSHEELRYSLRSLKNLKHDRVFVVGGCPDWADNVIHIEPEPGDSKWSDARSNIRAACMDPRVSDPFILFNDDYFIMEPIEEVPVLNRGTCRDVEVLLALRVGTSMYVRGMKDTRTFLEELGYNPVLCFDLHVPMVTDKKLRLQSMDLGQNLPVWHSRTAYGAMAGLVGETVTDPKITSLAVAPDPGPFVSTEDRSFRRGVVGGIIRHAFRRPSMYERVAE